MPACQKLLSRFVARVQWSLLSAFKLALWSFCVLRGAQLLFGSSTESSAGWLARSAGDRQTQPRPAALEDRNCRLKALKSLLSESPLKTQALRSWLEPRCLWLILGFSLRVAKWATWCDRLADSERGIAGQFSIWDLSFFGKVLRISAWKKWSSGAIHRSRIVCSCMQRGPN